MSETSETVVVTLPGKLIAEIEAVQESPDLETFVHQAIQMYITSLRQHRVQQQLADDYDQLALLYSELSSELADEDWLPLENEALTRTGTEMAS